MEEQTNYYAIIPADVRYSDIPANAKLLYGEITALCNEKGICWASNEYFANLYGVSKVSISKWVKSLIEKKFISSEIIYKDGTKEILNRYLTILKYPIKEKFNTPIKEKFKDNNISINNKEIYKESFEQWWVCYPRKIDKKKSLEKFTTILAEKKTTLEELIKGAKNYALHCQEENTEIRYIKHPTTWLNGECWQNEYTTAKEDYRKKYELF